MLEVPVLWALGGLLSLLMIVATALIRVSYSRVEVALAKVEKTLDTLTEHAHSVVEWRKGVDRRLADLERATYRRGHPNTTPVPGE